MSFSRHLQKMASFHLKIIFDPWMPWKRRSLAAAMIRVLDTELSTLYLLARAMAGPDSPGSCSSNSAQSLDVSQSSGSLSLSCTESDITDGRLQEVDYPEVLCGFCTSSKCLEAAPLEKQAIHSELGRLIRQDLATQRDAHVKPAGAGSGVNTDSPAAMSASAEVSRSLPAETREPIMGWMRQVSTALRLHPSTLFAATSFLDRFVAAAEAVPDDGELNLLALTCMSVAVKYNEIGKVAPSVWLGLAVESTGERLYTTCDLQRYEFTLLQGINWRVHDPTIYTFLEHFLMCQPPGCTGPNSALVHPATARSDVPPTVIESPVGGRAAMLAELSLMYDTFLLYDYSAIALACISLAERMVYGGRSGAVSGPQVLQPAVADAVAATSGLQLEAVAPGLARCVGELEKCSAALSLADSGTQAGTPHA